MKSLSVEDLLQTARERTGLSDFGPPDFMEGLRIAVDGINTEVQVRDDRWDHVRDRFLRVLMNRLWFAKDMTEHPEIAQEEIRDSVVITSMPRTGSTKLHRMLGASGDFQTLHLWHGHMFARIPGLPDGGRARRIAETEAYEKWMYEVSPGLLTGHAMFTHEPEEDIVLQEFSFRHAIIFGIFDTMKYAQWIMQVDMKPSFDYLLAQIKYLQWQNGSHVERPWLVKTPSHFGMEPYIDGIYEKPRYIVTHRDPAKCMPSITSTSVSWHKLYSDKEDNANISASMSQYFMLAANAHMKWRDENPCIPVLDLGFREVSENGIGAARRVYEFLNMSLTAKAEANMLHWEREISPLRYAKANYSANDIGTTDEAIRDTFKNYMDRYAQYF